MSLEITVFLLTDPFSVQLMHGPRTPYSGGQWRLKSSLPAAGQTTCCTQVDAFLVQRSHAGWHRDLEMVEPSRAKGSSSPRYTSEREVPSEPPNKTIYYLEVAKSFRPQSPSGRESPAGNTTQIPSRFWRWKPIHREDGLRYQRGNLLRFY